MLEKLKLLQSNNLIKISDVEYIVNIVRDFYSFEDEKYRIITLRDTDDDKLSYLLNNNQDKIYLYFELENFPQHTNRENILNTKNHWMFGGSIDKIEVPAELDLAKEFTYHNTKFTRLNIPKCGKIIDTVSTDYCSIAEYSNNLLIMEVGGIDKAGYMMSVGGLISVYRGYQVFDKDIEVLQEEQE